MDNKFAVIDTETTWQDEVMSIGVVISSFDGYKILDEEYYIISSTFKHGGMFSNALAETRGKKINVESRYEAITHIKELLSRNNVNGIFAYNASFDYRHLQELSSYIWFDIMKLAAYKQYNEKLPLGIEYCQTGRLKYGYGVESIYRYLSGKNYCEVHNALCDAEDELEIMVMLDKPFVDYFVTAINSPQLVSKFNKRMPQKKEEVRDTCINDMKVEVEDQFEEIDIHSLSAGTNIYHINFGEGVILSLIDEQFAEIKFKYYTKRLNLPFAIKKGYLKKRK